MNLRTRLGSVASLAAVALVGSALFGASTASATSGHGDRPVTVYTQTNDLTGNQVLAFREGTAGTLTPVGSYPTGGLGSGDGLGSQGAVVLSPNRSQLFVVNAGSDTVSVFRVGPDGSLTNQGQVASGGDRPVSVTVADGFGYVLNAASLSVGSFRYDGRGVAGTGNAGAPLGAGAAAPAQVSLTPDGRNLLVTEKASNTVDVLSVSHGRIGPPRTSPSSGTTPFGFAFTDNGVAVVSVAASAAAETFTIDRHGQAAMVDLESTGGQGAPCWVAVTRTGIAFTANAAANSISSFRVGRRGELTLLNSRAAATDPHPTDMALGARETWLYNLSDQGGAIDASTVHPDGTLTGTVAAARGLPTTITGLAATG